MPAYQDIEIRMGSPAAYQFLLEVEKASGIKSWLVAHLDPQVRLERAFKVQDALLATSAIAA